VNIKKRLNFYFLEADKHIEKLKRIKKELNKYYPLDVDKFEDFNENQKDKIDILIFRFMKLQDLIGEKIIKSYFEYNLIETNQPFIKLLSLLEKEEILEVDKFRELRTIRNKIAHDYPYDFYTLIEGINGVLENIEYLINIKENIKRKIDETNTK